MTSHVGKFARGTLLLRAHSVHFTARLLESLAALCLMGVGEGEAHGAALDCSGYVHCVEIPRILADSDGEDMRGSSKGALSLWSLIILDGGIKLPVGAP